jgi:hypothetical protein
MEKFTRITAEGLVETHEIKHKEQSDILTQSRFLKNTYGRIKTNNRSKVLQA